MTAHTGPKRRPSISLVVLLWARTRRNVVEYLPRLARVGALLVVVFGGLFLFVGHRAKADIHEVMLGFGAQMMRYDGADRQGAPRQVFMNGERMLLATASTTNSLDTVLDYYERRCMKRDGGLEQELLRVSGANRPGAPPIDERLIDTTIRHETGARGYVMCLDMGEGAISISELTQRLTAFADTGDLGEVGHLRYVYVTDEVTTRHVVTFWTEESFNIALCHAPPKLAPDYFVRRYTRSRRLVMQLSLKRRYPALKGLHRFFEVLNPGRNAVVGMSLGGHNKKKGQSGEKATTCFHLTTSYCSMR